MLNKKYLFVFAGIISIIINIFLSVNVWADTPAGDEQATLSNYLPDALIILDLSGSMAATPGADYTFFYGATPTDGSAPTCTADTTKCNNPADTTYPYSHDSTCTPDTVNCPGSPGTTYFYGADATCTANANAGACTGAPTSTYKYAYDKSCTANTTKCTSKSGTTCVNGFCNGTGQGNCVTDCSNGKYGYCSGGFCGVAKTGCNTDCRCQNGMCMTSRTNCANQCATNHCSGGFCQDTLQSDCQTDCSKLAIAKRSLFAILDDDGSGTIDALDAASLGIRFGFMRYKASDPPSCTTGNDTAGDYTSGAIYLVDKISELGSNGQTSYQLTYCGNTTSCASTATGCTTGECIVSENACGGTPLASALKEAKSYLDTHKSNDLYKACRQKFVIVMTDGADTLACSGSGAECQDKMYTRRREVVAATKQLADAGYKVFVVGFGSTMPDYLQNTLNWMAYYGLTDNPMDDNSPKASLSAYSIPTGCTADTPVPSACCNLSTNAAACFPSGITSGMTSTADTSVTCSGYDQWNNPVTINTFKAAAKDPGYAPLTGYAFLAGDATTLTTSLKSAINTIKEATYSFTHASVQAQRTTSENYLYEASFEPLKDPFWIGHLKRFSLANDSSGAINATADWDAGAVLQAVSDDGVSSPRNIYTTNGTSSTLQAFTSTNSNLTNSMFYVSTDAARIALIKFIRQGDYVYPTGISFRKWKLGDVLHTSPVVIPTPNLNFFDYADTNTNTNKAYATYASNNIRETTSTGTRIIIVGANDGQLHAFKTYDGSEAWSFIPPNLLSQLSLMTHASHPTGLTHTYFVDGPLGAAEVWIPSSGTGAIGSTAKSAGDWHTYLSVSEGRGGITSLWSSSTGCDYGFSQTYSSTYNNYCGYYTLDITNTTAAPIFKWRLGGTSGLSAADAAYLGQAWSRMFFGRVRINNNEKWVGIIGGGYSGTNCAGGGTCSDTRGKGFYVVDASNGSILWKFNYATSTSSTTSPLMVYNLVAEPLGVDSDNDGFMDTAYIGDLGGNVWRFKFCLKNDGTGCNTSNWTGGLLYNNH